MPSLDGDDRVVGSCARETPSTGYYVRCFLVLDFTIHKLRMYPEEVGLNHTQASCDDEINCQYITKVRASLTRPKALNSLEIVTTSGSHFLSIDSLEERDQWAESIRKASMRQGSAKQLASLIQKQEDGSSYRAKVVGGVVHKIPINSEGHKDISGSSDVKEVDPVGRASIGGRRTRGFPRIIKAGYGTKLGQVRKNWKKRFFVLTEIALGYYKTIEEVEPIRAISVAEITSVKQAIDAGRELMEVVTPSRTFQVQFDTHQELEDWVEDFKLLLGSVKPTDSSQLVQTAAGSSLASAMGTPSPSSTDTASLDSNEYMCGTLV